MVGDGGVHLDLAWVYGSGRWRRSISFSLLHWRAAGVGLPLRQVTEPSLGWGRLCGAEVTVLMGCSSVLKVTDRLRRAEMLSESYLLLQMLIIRCEGALPAAVALVRLLPGFADRAAAAAAVLFLG